MEARQATLTVVMLLVVLAVGFAPPNDELGASIPAKQMYDTCLVKLKTCQPCSTCTQMNALQSGLNNWQVGLNEWFVDPFAREVAPDARHCSRQIKRNYIKWCHTNQTQVETYAMHSFSGRYNMSLTQALKNQYLDFSRRDLSRVGLMQEELKVVAYILSASRVLTTLDLRANGIGPAGAKAMADALLVNRVLTTLWLNNNNIQDQGAIALADALKGNGVLAQLWIPENQISDQGAIALADALKGNGVLTTLGLWGNSIGDDGATAIADALKGNGVLTNLDLDGNKNIGAKGKEALALVAARHPGMQLWY